MNKPEEVLGGGVPGGLPDDGPGILVTTLTPDERLFWGVVIFWVARKLLVSEGGRYFWLLRKLLRLGLDLISLGQTLATERVVLAEKLRAGTLGPNDVLTAPAAPGFVAVSDDPDFFDASAWPLPRIPSPSGDLTQANAFRDALAALLGHVNGTPSPGRVLKKLDIPSLVNCVLGALHPRVSFGIAEKNRNVPLRTIAWQAADNLEPILMAPVVSHPMWQALRDISPEWILPGIGELGRNTVSLVRTNQPFIEAFMAGLNHEMTRELVWNGYPTDQRGTYFQQFWDFRGWARGAGEAPREDTSFADIQPIAQWRRDSALGENEPLPQREQLVLLVRGDVIRRYPNVVVYATTAAAAGGLDDTKHRYPSFQGVLSGDVAYYGFDLDATFNEQSVRGTPGWFFILQEHPSEPRFRQSIAVQASGVANAELADFVRAAESVPGAAAELAFRAYDVPLRVAFRGKDLLPVPV